MNRRQDHLRARPHSGPVRRDHNRNGSLDNGRALGDNVGSANLRPPGTLLGLKAEFRSTMYPNSELPLISIAVPTFNRPILLDRALLQLRAQTYRNIEILVADNASTDPQAIEVIEKHRQSDQRVRVIRRSSNIGAFPNYMNSAYETVGEYIMWAANDDQWSPDFISELYDCLQQNPAAGFAFCGMDIVNLNGRRIGELATYSRFTSSGNLKADARKFLEDHEIGGKSNPIYGLYRRTVMIETIDRLWKDQPSRDGVWSADVVFVFAAMIKHGFVGIDKVMFTKLKPTLRDHWVEYESRWYSGGIPLKEYRQYTDALAAAVEDEQLKRLVERIMLHRLFKELLIGKPMRPIAKLLRRATRSTRA